jgi:hypothetical protein
MAAIQDFNDNHAKSDFSAAFYIVIKGIFARSIKSSSNQTFLVA